MISQITVTTRNYRTPQFRISEKTIIAGFPEARRKGVSVLPRQAGQERGEKTVINLFYYSTFFIFVSQICAENRRDPELPFFGSDREK
ncbi:hypothetical protein A3N46_19925 [Enterobacter asburiae]|nr:hypothetical protein A3N46_19925 [Enterobacter asburiae]